jgi:RNA polymerase sigma factor (sigma-70 family)
MASDHLDGVMHNLRAMVAGQGTRDVPDDELLGRYVASRDEAAFAALVQRHGGMVLSVCRHRLRRLQDAEDACQAVFLILARKAASIRQRESLAGWLHGVAYRVARDHAARLARRETTNSETSDLTGDAADQPSLREFQTALDEEFRRLPDQFRAPLVLCYLEGKTRDEAAQRLGWTLATLRGRLERGKELLRHRLVRRGFLSGAALFATIEASSAAPATIPIHLFVSTTKAALCFAANTGAAAELISAPVAELTKGVLRSMFLAKVKLAAAACIAVGVLGLGAGGGIYVAAAGGHKTVVVAQAEAPKAPAVAEAPAVKPALGAPAAPVPAAPAQVINAFPAPGAVGAVMRPIGFMDMNGGIAAMVQDASTIVIGKVTKIEDKDQLDHKIAVIKIEETLKGPKGLTSIRVGFNAKEAPLNPPDVRPVPRVLPVNPPGGGFGGNARPAAMIARLPQVTLTEGQEACFLLKAHEKGDFSVLLNPHSANSCIDKKARGGGGQIQLVREVAKFLETPLEKSLDAEKSEDRLLAAGLLILKYRTRKDFTVQAKEEPIDAAESKKILKALADAEMMQPEPRLGMSAYQLFFRLGVSNKDGLKVIPDPIQPPRPGVAPGGPVKVLPVLPPQVPNPVPAPGAPAAPVKAPAAPAPAPAAPAVPLKGGTGPERNPATAPGAPAAPVRVPAVPAPNLPPGAAPGQPAQAPAVAPVQVVPLPAVARPVQINNGPMAEAIKAWLKKNADTYRIKRFVEAKADKDPTK